jgi:SulP family sulfate permease
MQRRASAAVGSQGEYEVVNLLRTDVRDEYKQPPLAERVKSFVQKNYTVQKLLPAARWVPEYFGEGPGGWRANLTSDVFAAATIAAFLVPQGMSYALVANLPPIYGLYCATFPLIVYGLFGTSKQLSMGAVAIVSLIIGHGLQDITPPTLPDGTANPEYVSLAIATSFFCGVLQLAMGLLKMGFVTRLLSHPVLSGFTSAAALIIGAGQVKHVLGFSPIKTDNLFVLLADIIVRIPAEAHWPSTVMGLVVVVLLLAFKNIKLLSKLPAAMIMVLLGILVSWQMDLGAKYGFIVAGSVPSGIPAPSLPHFPSSEHLGEIVTLAVVCSLIGYMESMAVGMVYASKNGYELVPDQELVALGLANLVGSFFNCYPTYGGFGRTAVAAKSGSRTQLAGILAGLLMLVVLSFLTSYFYHLPRAVLGAIVIVAVAGLLDTAEPKRLWKTEAYEDLASLIVTFLATCVVGVETGVGIGVGLSLFVLVARSATPTYVVLGHCGAGAYHDMKTMEAAKAVPGHLIIRFDRDLWFANSLPFMDAVTRELRLQRDAGSPAQRLVLDLSGVNHIDSSAMHALHHLVHDLKHDCPDLEIAFAGAKRNCRRRILKEIKVVTHGHRMGRGNSDASAVDADLLSASSANASVARSPGKERAKILSDVDLDLIFENFKDGGDHIPLQVARDIVRQVNLGVSPKDLRLDSTLQDAAGGADVEMGVRQADESAAKGGLVLSREDFHSLVANAADQQEGLSGASFSGEDTSDEHEAVFFSNVHAAATAPLPLSLKAAEASRNTSGLATDMNV